MTYRTRSQGWVFCLGLGLSLALHGGLAVWLLSRGAADFGATDFTTTAISVNIEATDIINAVEQSAARDAAQLSVSRPAPAPASNALPERTETPEPEPARAHTDPSHNDLETAPADAAQAPASALAPGSAPAADLANTNTSELARAEIAPTQNDSGIARAEATQTDQPQPARSAAADAGQNDLGPAEAVASPLAAEQRTVQAAESREDEARRALDERGEAARRASDEARQAPQTHAARTEREVETRDAATERRVERARQVKQSQGESKQRRTRRAAKPEASGSRGATASAGRVSASQGSVQNYKGILDAWMARNRPRSIHGPGKVEMLIALSPSGALISARIVASSGNQALDQAALENARRSSPFPKPPPGWTDPQRRIIIPYRFL